MSLAAKGVTASILGVTAHLTLFIHGEWHMRAPIVIIVHLLLAGLTIFADVRGQSFPPSSLATSSVIIASYIISLFASITIYRLSPRHRLAKFPGPRLAAVSKLWHVWQCRDSRNHELMGRLHEEYGDFARIGPSEICSFHPESFAVLEGYGTQCRKSDFYDLLLPDFSLVFTRDKAMHDARRKVWSRALSTQAIETYRNRIDRQIKVLVNGISDMAASNQPILINEIMYWFAFDSMGEFAFNQDFGMMRRREWHFCVILFRRALSVIGPFGPCIWLIRVAFAFIPWFWKIGSWFEMLAFCHQQLEQRMKTEPEEKDIASFFIEEAEREGYSSSALRWLRGDGPTVVVAGSDTTAPTLTFLLYCLAKYPEHANKCRAELDGVDPFDLTAVSAIPHVQGFINEVMRLFPVASTTVTRETPLQGVMLGETFIPGTTKVISPRWIIFRLESCFERGNELIPERWYSKPEMVRNKRAFAPFGTGRASCVGQGLATVQVRLVMASLLKRFDIQFMPDDDGSEMLRGMRDQLTSQLGPLRLVFKSREKT